MYRFIKFTSDKGSVTHPIYGKFLYDNRHKHHLEVEDMKQFAEGNNVKWEIIERVFLDVNN